MNFTGIFSQGGVKKEERERRENEIAYQNKKQTRQKEKREREIGYERKERIKEEENERVTVIFTELLHETRPPRPFRFIIMFQLSLKGRNESNVPRK